MNVDVGNTNTYLGRIPIHIGQVIQPSSEKEEAKHFNHSMLSSLLSNHKHILQPLDQDSLTNKCTLVTFVNSIPYFLYIPCVVKAAKDWICEKAMLHDTFSSSSGWILLHEDSTLYFKLMPILSSHKHLVLRDICTEEYAHPYVGLHEYDYTDVDVNVQQFIAHVRTLMWNLLPFHMFHMDDDHTIYISYIHMNFTETHQLGNIHLVEYPFDITHFHRYLLGEVSEKGFYRVLCTRNLEPLVQMICHKGNWSHIKGKAKCYKLSFIGSLNEYQASITLHSQ